MVSSEDFGESPQPQKLHSLQSSTGGGFQDKETPSSPAPSSTLIQNSNIQQRTQVVTELHLAKIEKMFENDIDATGVPLDKEAFVRTMKKVLSSVSDEVLEALFLKVDSDCNGFVTWQKYVDYMMREFRGKEEMRKSQYRLRFRLPMTTIPLNHGCEVVKVEFIVQRSKKIGYFLTVTKDGVLQFWSETFLLISSFKLNQVQQLYSQQMWVIDMVCLHNMSLIAVASTDLKIEFFDISNRNCVWAFTFIDLDSCVLVMDYWSDYLRGVFCYGDTKGNVIIFTSDNVTNGLFNPCILPRTSKWDHWISISMQKLLNEKSTTYRSYRLRALHSNWCEQVKFIPQLNLVASCSAIDKSSLVLTILPVKDPDKPKSSVLNLRKGILCFAYCQDRNFLVTGGYDPHIRLWNPFVSKKPVWLMKGHQTSVTHVLIDSKNSSILISISRDKNIRVWDLQDYICLQSFCGKMFSLGNCPITSAYFHRKDSTLVCSTYSIGILKGYLEAQGPVKAGKITTHSTALCAVLYSKIFKQVVSGCLHGMVNVWEITSGRRVMEFSVSGTLQVELTAMALDESERCVLTGLRDGTMKMWNYNIGECLMTFPSPDQVEISGIVHMNKVFYMTGWSKRITNFMFHKTKPVLLCYHWQTFHTEDVLSMARYQNQFLGTSSYNGDILFWNVNTLKPILNFNASKSPLPLQPKKVQEAEECKARSSRPRKSYEAQKWAHKALLKPRTSHPWSLANTSLRQNLMSAPPVMKHPRDKEPDKPVPQQMPVKTGGSKVSNKLYGKPSFYKESEKRKGEFQKMLLQSSASVEKIIFLQTRPRLPHTAAMLSSCIDGCIYAWSIHGNGGLLGKFPVDLKESADVVVGAMATDENDWILITGDCKGNIKIWDIKDYCTFIGQQLHQPSGIKISVETVNKFRFLIPKRLQMNTPYYIPLEEKEVVAGQTISLVPPKLLITWKGHLESVADILYVDSFQLIISAGQDGDVKAWKLSGDAIGTFGLTLWERLQDATMDNIYEEGMEDEADSTGSTVKASHSELHRDLAEALVYQRREQVALMALLNGKAGTEAEAWARLEKIAQTSPWVREQSLEDIEESWLKWVSMGKQVSRIVGAAYKPKEHLRNHKLLSTNVQYSWMKHQVSPQVYQSLYFFELKPVQQPNFMMHKVLDGLGRHNHPVADDIQKDLGSVQEQILMDAAAGMPTAIASLSSLSLAASDSRLLDSNLCASLRPPSSGSLLWPWSASTAQSVLSTPLQGSEFISQRTETFALTASPLDQHMRSLGATLKSSVKGDLHIRL